MASKPNIFVLLLLLLLMTTAVAVVVLASSPATATATAVANAYFLCDEAMNRTFLANLDMAIITEEVVVKLMESARGSGGFAKAVSRDTANHTVYGLAACRGDAVAAECAKCLSRGNSTLVDGPCLPAGGSVWLDELCFLRLSARNFLGILDTAGVHVVNSQNFTGASVNAFDAAVTVSLSWLVSKAVGNTGSRYACGDGAQNGSVPVYGAVQCWRDISMQDCRSCLDYGLGLVRRQCSRSTGCVFLLRSCVVRYELYDFCNSSAGFQSAFVMTPNSRSSGSFSTRKKRTMTATMAAISLVLICLVVLLVIQKRRIRRLKRQASDLSHLSQSQQLCVSYDSQQLPTKQERVNYSMAAIACATGNFDQKFVIGEGGYGIVYKGTLQDGRDVAVKRLILQSSSSGNEEIFNEVSLLIECQHKNLVRILGCCLEGTEVILIYEYMPNGSLDKLLFDPEKRKELGWPKRRNIILGIARGLAYLHEGSRLKIVHRDIKASNILLDENLDPKIADFGLAKLFPEDKTYVLSRIVGTCGYVAPEYMMQGLVSTKSDVYSFGVLLMEIISGRKNTTEDSSCNDLENVVDWAWRLHKEANVEELVEKSIKETASGEEVLRFIRVGLLCTDGNASFRPSMSDVLGMLYPRSDTLPFPMSPPYADLC